MTTNGYIKKCIDELDRLLQERKYQDIINNCEEIINLADGLAELQVTENEIDFNGIDFNEFNYKD